MLGFVSATGIAGLTVGGGFGYLTRRHGWTCDNVVSMEVVTAGGDVLRLSADENEDLYWALRGGSGNFGIVTSAGDDDINVQWARDCFEATRSCSTGGTYINFLTEDEGQDRIKTAYGHANLGRLAALKRKYDPENFFRHTKSVSP